MGKGRVAGGGGVTEERRSRAGRRRLHGEGVGIVASALRAPSLLRFDWIREGGSCDRFPRGLFFRLSLLFFFLRLDLFFSFLRGLCRPLCFQSNIRPSFFRLGDQEEVFVRPTFSVLKR